MGEGEKFKGERKKGENVKEKGRKGEEKGKTEVSMVKGMQNRQIKVRWVCKE